MNKDDMALFSPYELLTGINAEIAVTLLKWFIKGNKSIAITGDMDVGKTKMLQSIIGFVNPSNPIYVFDYKSELNLHEHYPAYTVIPIKGSEIIPIYGVTVVGDVETENQVKYIMRNTVKATLYTHYAKTTDELVTYLAKKYSNSNKDMKLSSAIGIVSKERMIDCHMAIRNGKCIIERITEVIPSDTKSDTFNVRTLVKWHNERYYLVSMPTDYTLKDIKERFSDEERTEFKNDMQNIMKISRGA